MNSLFIIKIIPVSLCLSLAITFSVFAMDKNISAAEQEEIIQTISEKFSKATYSRKGADTCLKCHDQSSNLDSTTIFLGRHGVLADPKSPMSVKQLQCESCHGPLGRHDKRPRKGKSREMMITFNQQSPLSADQKNSICMNCHDDHNRMGWLSSAHESEEIACVDCHTLHVKKDPILMADQQNKMCTSCHTKQKIEIHKRSSHPIKFNRQQCTDCHNPHDSINEASLKLSSVNETCYSCHNEMQAPVFWEHDPVKEDCTSCHNAHGSNNAMLLKQRAPQLCQECHSSVGHSSIAYSGALSNKVQGKSCLNCHSKIHGSNHPQGHLFQK